MTVALVTGAARGFGLRPRPRPRRPRLAPSSSTPATPPPCAPPRRLPARPGSSPSPATSPTRRHRGALLAAARGAGGLDLLVNNASELGPSPLPRARPTPARRAAAGARDERARPARADPGSCCRCCARAGGRRGNLSSDAAVEAYPGWGGYGAAKAALDQLAAVLGVEEPRCGCYAFDPGDMRTAMHQRAFPGEDISDRPEPATVVPGPAAAARPAGPRAGATGPPTCPPAAREHPAAPPRREPATSSPCPPSCRPTEPPEARGVPPRRGAPAGGPRPAAAAATAGSATCPRRSAPGDLRRGQHLGDRCPPPSTACAPDGPVTVHVHVSARQLDDGCCGRSSCAPTPAGRRALADGRAGESSPAAPTAGGARGSTRPTRPRRRRRRLWRATVAVPAPVRGRWLTRHGRPIRLRLRCAATGRSTSTRPSSPKPGPNSPAPRCPAPAGRSPAAAGPACVAAASGSPSSSCTPGCPRPRPASRRCPSATGCPRRTADAVERAHARPGGRVVAVGTTVDPRARDGGRARRRVRAGERLDRPRAGARPPGAGRRRAGDRLARAGGLAPAAARGRRRPRPRRAGRTPRRSPRGTCGTSSATAVCSSRVTEVRAYRHPCELQK